MAELSPWALDLLQRAAQLPERHRRHGILVDAVDDPADELIAAGYATDIPPASVLHDRVIVLTDAGLARAKEPAHD